MNWNQIIQDTISATLGSFIGIGAAFLIYRLQTRESRRDKAKEEKELNQHYIESFAFTVDDIIEGANQQIENFEAFIKEAKEQTSHIPVLKSTLVNFDRLLRSSQLDNYLLAVRKRMPGINTIEIFESIIHGVEYLKAQNDGIIQAVQEGVRQQAQRKQGFSKLYQETYNAVGQIYTDPTQLGEPATMEFHIVINEFFAEEFSEDDIDYFYNKFFLPLNELVISQIDRGLPPMPHLNKLGALTATAKSLYREIIKSNETGFEEIQTMIDHYRDGIKDVDEEMKKVV